MAQVTPAQPNRSLDYAQDFAGGLRRPLNGSSYSRSTKQIPRLRSGFRQRAQTPAKWLKLLPLNQTDPSTTLRISPAGSDARSTAQVIPAQPNRSLDYARDFASGLRRPLNGSSYSRSTKQIPRL